MSRGLGKRWERGERTTVEGRDQKGKPVQLRGKHGGLVVKQEVVLVLEPKGSKC